nr:hypothetical protein [Tanacetum cinerariifolium]
MGPLIRQYTKKIKEQEDLIETLSDQLVEERHIVKTKQTEISKLEECLRNKELQSENEHLKSKVIDCQMCQNLQVQVEELKSVNESFNLSIEELYKARALVEATLRERDEKIYVLQKKLRLLEEQSKLNFFSKENESLKDDIKSLQTENNVLKSGESELSEKIDQMKSQVSELLEKLQISNLEMKQQTILFEEDKRMFFAKNEFLEKSVFFGAKRVK